MKSMNFHSASYSVYFFTNLGNWFISAAAELATKSDLFSKVVPPNQSFRENYAGNLKDLSRFVTLTKCPR